MVAERAAGTDPFARAVLRRLAAVVEAAGMERLSSWTDVEIALRIILKAFMGKNTRGRITLWLEGSDVRDHATALELPVALGTAVLAIRNLRYH